MKVQCSYCKRFFECKKNRIKKTKNICCSKICANYILSNERKGDKNPFWKGGKQKTSAGYINIINHFHKNKTSKNLVKEHVLVVEDNIGRLLRKNEIIHHINKKKDDNKIQNLLLLKNQKEHRRIHEGWFKIKNKWYKNCKKCGNLLEVNTKNFHYKHKNNKQFSVYCKLCVKKYNKKYHDKNKSFK